MYKNILYDNLSVLQQQYILLADIPYQSFWVFFVYIKTKILSCIFQEICFLELIHFFFCLPSVCSYGLCYSVIAEVNASKIRMKI